MGDWLAKLYSFLFLADIGRYPVGTAESSSKLSEVKATVR